MALRSPWRVLQCSSWVWLHSPRTVWHQPHIPAWFLAISAWPLSSVMSAAGLEKYTAVALWAFWGKTNDDQQVDHVCNWILPGPLAALHNASARCPCHEHKWPYSDTPVDVGPSPAWGQEPSQSTSKWLLSAVYGRFQQSLHNRTYTDELLHHDYNTELLLPYLYITVFWNIQNMACTCNWTVALPNCCSHAIPWCITLNEPARLLIDVTRPSKYSDRNRNTSPVHLNWYTATQNIKSLGIFTYTVFGVKYTLLHLPLFLWLTCEAADFEIPHTSMHLFKSGFCSCSGFSRRFASDIQQQWIITTKGQRYNGEQENPRVRITAK